MIFKNVDELLKHNKSEISFSTINGVFDLLHKGHRDAINQCLAKVEKLSGIAKELNISTSNLYTFTNFIY